MWNVIDTGKRSAKENMELDAKLLDSLRPEDEPILHLYEWETDAATYGYFIKLEQFVDREKARARGVDFARRPTGGGILFHLFDLAFSVLVPSGHKGYFKDTLDNYAFVNKYVQKAVRKFLNKSSILLPEEPTPLSEKARSFCYAKPTIYDVMIGERKVAGAAQRRKRQGYLHQGSVALAPPNEELLSAILVPDEGILEGMRTFSHSLLAPGYTKGDLDELRGLLKEALKEAFLYENGD